MKTQGIITVHPKNEEEANALKAVMKAMKIGFEISKEDSCDPSLVAIEHTTEQVLQDLDESVKNLKRVQAGELQATTLKELLHAI